MSDITLINLTIAKHFSGKVVYKHNSVGVFRLIAVLEKAGFKVNFSEYCLDHRNSFSEEIKCFISIIDPASPLIGIGCHSVHLPFAVMAAKELKKRFPDKKIIMGGIGPSMVAKKLLERFDFINAVVIGEAEETIVEVVKNSIKSFKGIKGVLYRDNGTVGVNAPRLPIEDLDAIPLPAYHAVNFKEQYQIPIVFTSRGCPFGCSFCGLSAFWGRKVRYRSFDNIIEELRLLTHNYGMKYYFFGDPTFTLNKDRALEFCQRLQKENLGIRFDCMARIDCIDEELMEEMAKSGCEAPFYGLESGSDDVLKRVKQGVTVKQALEVIKKSIRHFKTVEVGLMWGFPFETLDDFKQTINAREYLEDELGCGVQLRWLEPYPCTALYNEFKNELFLPYDQSAIFRFDMVHEAVAKGKKFYEPEKYTSQVNIPPDVTSVRFMIAASHIASLCRETIEQNQDIFCDYYRYKTPALKEKLESAQRYSIY
ncbi:MAG: B12-binding domain-containing radical SAM protein [Candidatus Omnitrophica bacterium]|nr:B12-binding domain-containing radical SAM protein [Candidatus Omnitrophota bacterium]MBU4148915.1 B12-binding domain-containing radical SAM protein [Candidatus Omnitrophota bacterium]